MKNLFILKCARIFAQYGLSRFYQIRGKKEYYVVHWFSEICVTDGSNDRYLTFNLG